MRKILQIFGFVILLIIISATSYLLFKKNKKPEYEYANYPAEITGTFVHVKTKQSRDKYYILVDNENNIPIMKMRLEDVIIQNIEKEEILLNDIHTGDTIKVNFLGDIVASYPAIITKIQTVTLLEQNSEADIDALLKLVPDS